MAEAEWDAEHNKAAVVSKWDGEDEEDDIKDNWDDDGDEEKTDEQKTGGLLVTQVKKKRSMKELIAEKEEKKRKEIALKKLKEKEELEALTPEKMLEEKIRQQKLQEDSDLEMAKDAFGITDTNSTGSGIESMNPTSKEEFDEFGTLLSQKISPFSNSIYYSNFLEDLFRNVCANMDSEEIKKLGSALNILSSEKMKAQKAQKGGGKKKSKKGGVKLERDADYAVVDDYRGDEYDDFI
ncbi:Eukaryotic translation initiation factor 3 subunit J [Nymphon striatum]|nr:Eukaryotic translation initiation factor 3 subunit J [Nymphon striatum]